MPVHGAWGFQTSHPHNTTLTYTHTHTHTMIKRSNYAWGFRWPYIRLKLEGTRTMAIDQNWHNKFHPSQKVLEGDTNASYLLSLIKGCKWYELCNTVFAIRLIMANSQIYYTAISYVNFISIKYLKNIWDHAFVRSSIILDTWSVMLLKNGSTL